jgi:hypothetical protein
MPIGFLTFLSLPVIFVLIDFFTYLLKGKRLYYPFINRILEIIIVIVLPLLYLIILDESKNDCCSDSATFSPDHKITIYTFIALCVISFFHSVYKKKVSTPVIEVATNSMLIIGIVLNIFIAIQIEEYLWIFANLPIIILFIQAMLQNQKRLVEYLKENEVESNSFLEKSSWKILKYKPIIKIPILFLLCLPIIAIITGFLLLFGQKPDSLIRAFTDTYKHGLSQLDHMCYNVTCSGHYLCSVAANGHQNIVKPQRLGVRNGKTIICNRQLLIANAFEDLIQEKMPKTHKIIRKNYNKVGNIVHKYYKFFDIKVVSDFIYFIMKPFELFFLFVLYTFDYKPENRIAIQYLKEEDRYRITNYDN